jgi:hypothetical protein
MRMRSWLRLACAGAVLSCAAMAARGKVVISLDYSLDGPDGMFDATTAQGRAARAAMERAAQVYADRFVDNLTAITSGGGNSWSGRIVNPGTGDANYAPGLTGVAANVIKVYVGGREFTGLDVANGGAGGADVTGSSAFQANAASRGQAGALASPATDVGPWGGSVAFDTATNWYFGLGAGGLSPSTVDFLSVATHELAHLLGFSSSQASWEDLVSSGRFTGAAATAVNGGVAPTVSGSHWLGMTSRVGSASGPVQVALMEASVTTGVRRRVTLLDWAALDDIGWELARPGDATADGVVDYRDFQAFELGFGVKEGARWSQGDFNEDGAVDLADFRVLMRGLQGTSGAAAAEAWAGVNAPEPGIGAILAGAGMMVMRRRRR